MFYNEYYLLGMHILWWFFWIFSSASVFFYLIKLKENKGKKYNPIDLLKHRLAAGFINNYEYLEKKKLLENDLKE